MESGTLKIIKPAVMGWQKALVGSWYDLPSLPPPNNSLGQLFSHVIVIDFESTCWKDKRGAQEISEL